MTYEVQLGQEVLFEPLPDDVKQKVVARDCYWLPDEAASIYRHATAMVSFEMHSPILAHRMGTPAILVRQPTDTCKGQMWRDVQLADWMFEVDETDGNEIANRLTDIVTCPEQTREKLKASRTYVDRCMKEASQTISNELK
jgi:polysaccharide pyruvyl transferase WcaK-like protein